LTTERQSSVRETHHGVAVPAALGTIDFHGDSHMTPRTILILALRILAFWCLVGAVTNLSSAAVVLFTYGAALLSGRPSGFGSNYYPGYSIVITFVQPVLLLAVAAILGFCAPGIASFYYRADEPPGVRTAEVTLAAVYRIVIQGLGVVTCLRAVSPLANALAWWGTSTGFLPSNPRGLVTILEATLYIIVGVALIGFAGALARWATISRSKPARGE
jgi:hypothetical protein